MARYTKGLLKHALKKVSQRWTGSRSVSVIVIGLVTFFAVVGYLQWKTQSGIAHVGWAFGKKWEVRVWANYLNRPAQLRLAEGFFQKAKNLESQLWLEKYPENTLSTFNRSVQTESLSVPAEIPRALQKLQTPVTQTEGVSDPTLKPLMEIFWPGEEFNRAPASPEPGELNGIRDWIGLSKLKWNQEPPTLSKTHPKVYLDLQPWVAAVVAEELELTAAKEKTTAFEIQTDNFVHSWRSDSGEASQEARELIQKRSGVDFPKTSGSFAWIDFIQTPKGRSPNSALQLVDVRDLDASNSDLSAVMVFCRSPLAAITWSRASLVLGSKTALERAEKFNVPLRVRTLSGAFQVSSAWKQLASQTPQDKPYCL